MSGSEAKGSSVPKNVNRARSSQRRPRSTPRRTQSAATQSAAAKDDLNPRNGRHALSRWQRFLREGANGQRQRIGERMVRAGLIDKRQLDDALQVQKGTGQRTVNTLVALGYIRSSDFCDFLAREVGVATISLANYEVPGELRALLSQEFALCYEVLPLGRMGNTLTLGMACPIDHAVIEEVERHTGLSVRPILCDARALREITEQYYGLATKKTDPS